MTKPSPVLILFITSVASFCTSFAASSVNVALPLVGSEFHLGGVALNWVVTAFVLTTAVLVLPMGRMGDRHGRQRIFAWGMVLYLASTIAAYLAPSIAFLYTARVITGVGAAMAFSTVTAVLVAAFPPDKRGRVLGLNVAMVYSGMSLGPVLGGLVTHALGWRSLFALHALLSLLVVILILFRLRGNDRGHSKIRFDLAGSGLYALGLGLLIAGVSFLPQLGGMVLTGTGAAALVFFLVYESRIGHPVFPVGLFARNRVFALSNLSAMISYCATFAVTFFLSLFLQVVQGRNPAETGLILVVQPVIQAVFSPLTGRWSDRVSPRILASAGMAVTAAGLVLLTLMDASTPLGWELAALVLLGLGFALFSSPNTNAIMGSVEPKDLGQASATVATMRVVGQMLSMGLALTLLAVVMGNAPVDPEHVGPFLWAQRGSFFTFAILCALGIGASLARNAPASSGAKV